MFRAICLLCVLLGMGCGRSHLIGTSSDASPTGIARSDAGPLPTLGAVGPCGAMNELCCLGAACDEGLACGTDFSCCGVPGGPSCESDSDCCSGLQCELNACVSPRGGVCTGSTDCAVGLFCELGICGEPPPEITAPCGLQDEPCCIGGTCDEGLMCATSLRCQPDA